jgi:hypothetical protein
MTHRRVASRAAISIVLAIHAFRGRGMNTEDLTALHKIVTIAIDRGARLGLSHWGSPIDMAHGFIRQCLKNGEPLVINQSLEELILACGNDFMNVRAVFDGDGNITNWIAEGRGDPIPFTISRTPQIAVYELLLALKDRKIPKDTTPRL